MNVMQIQLKQAEIVVALKQYIENQGINLSGKNMSVDFTAGRKESGITADLVIEDATTNIPGFTDAPEAPAKPALTVVASPAEPADEPVAQPEAPVATPSNLFS